MKKFNFVLALTPVLLALSSCTISIAQVHTEGSASDVVDDTDTTTPTVSIPVSVVPT